MPHQACYPNVQLSVQLRAQRKGKTAVKSLYKHTGQKKRRRQITMEVYKVRRPDSRDRTGDLDQRETATFLSVILVQKKAMHAHSTYLHIYVLVLVCRLSRPALLLVKATSCQSTHNRFHALWFLTCDAHFDALTFSAPAQVHSMVSALCMEKHVCIQIHSTTYIHMTHTSVTTRRLNRPALLVVNKADAMPSELSEEDTRKMGLGKPIYISVSHNQVCWYSVQMCRVLYLLLCTTAGACSQRAHTHTHIVEAINHDTNMYFTSFTYDTHI